ncbi:MAG: hypothetical protein ACR2GH_11055 [Pseudonocardia sp.]
MVQNPVPDVVLSPATAKAHVTTPWGLFRYRWVVVKELFAIVVIVSAIAVTNGWITLAAAEVAGSPGDRPLTWLPVAGSVGHAVLLAAATVLSAAKPWGRTRPTGTL